jgi:peptidoglycan DL-endopeptidase CwlO
VATPHASAPARRRRIALLIGASVLGVLASLMNGAPALATPSPAELQKEIDAQNKVLEPIIERYNTLRVKLASDQAKAKALSAQLVPAQLQATTAQTSIGNIASGIYQTGGISTAQALVGSGDTSDLLDVLGALSEIARQRAATISAASKIVNKYEGQATSLAKLIAQEKQQYAELQSQKSSIQKKVDALQKLIDQAGGGGSGSGDLGSGPYTKSELMPAACPAGGSGKGLTAAKKACSIVWDLNWDPHWHMYGWGDAGRSRYDCSGLTMTAWKAAGVSLPHSAADQSTNTYTTKLSSASQLQVGDLVAYYYPVSHIAIYVGGGWIVHASHTGAPVRMARMNYTTPHYYLRVNT